MQVQIIRRHLRVWNSSIYGREVVWDYLRRLS